MSDSGRVALSMMLLHALQISCESSSERHPRLDVNFSGKELTLTHDLAINSMKEKCHTLSVKERHIVQVTFHR